jgi:hypothetical protein
VSLSSILTDRHQPSLRPHRSDLAPAVCMRQESPVSSSDCQVGGVQADAANRILFGGDFHAWVLRFGCALEYAGAC